MSKQKAAVLSILFTFVVLFGLTTVSFLISYEKAWLILGCAVLVLAVVLEVVVSILAAKLDKQLRAKGDSNEKT